MPKRNRPGLSENTRKRIKTTMIVKRLIDHIDGNIELTATQIRAAEILLNKTLPNLQALEIDALVQQEQRIVTAEPMTIDEYADQYHLGAASGPTESIN